MWRTGAGPQQRSYTWIGDRRMIEVRLEKHDHSLKVRRTIKFMHLAGRHQMQAWWGKVHRSQIDHVHAAAFAEEEDLVVGMAVYAVEDGCFSGADVFYTND